MSWKNTPPWRAIEVPSRRLILDDRLMGVIADLDVEEAVRYRPQGRTTFCNIFVTDVIRNCRIAAPDHWMNKGVPTQGHSHGEEYTANMLHDWFIEHGPKFGWKEVDEEGAKQHAAIGLVAVACWKNPDTRRRPGHIAVFRKDGLIAQAGFNNFEKGTLQQGFGTASPIRFFAIDTYHMPHAAIGRPKK